MNKRNFLKSLISVPAMASMGFTSRGFPEHKKTNNKHGLKISLNAYSFNQPLSRGDMDLEELFEFCADHYFDAVDPTGYYFPGYPEVPSDAYLYGLKRKAFQLGLEISGTGVRNDFAEPDKNKRREDIELIKNWIIAAEKIGAPVIRIFSGKHIPEGFTREQVTQWMVRDIQECVEFGKQHGVVVAVQNHNDFIQTAAQAKALIQSVGSPWFGLILDTGSYGTEEPYDEIQNSIAFAVSWQIKEQISMYGTEEPIDLEKVMTIIKASDYRGYLPIETLGPGDPFKKVPAFLEQVQLALSQ